MSNIVKLLYVFFIKLLPLYNPAVIRYSLVGCVAKHVIQEVTSSLLDTVLPLFSKLNFKYKTYYSIYYSLHYYKY